MKRSLKNIDEIKVYLRSVAQEKNRVGMKRFGVHVNNALGVSIPNIRACAKLIGKDHSIALDLWAIDVHEARILASVVDQPEQVTPEQMDAWAHDFKSWDLCDQVCQNLFVRVPHAYTKILEWSQSEQEFVKRSAFALIALAAIHIKELSDEQIGHFLLLIKQAACDERNFVKKAVNWALRNLGKRSSVLHHQAIEAAQEIVQFSSASARWIARDALRELQSDAVKKRVQSKR